MSDLIDARNYRQNRDTFSKEGRDFQVQAAYDAYVELLGREPSEAELQKAISKFSGTGGYDRGREFVQQQADLLKQKEDLQKEQEQQQQAETPQAVEANYGNQIRNQFQSILGRDPTSEEISHFGVLMARGFDPYQIGESLKATTEYLNLQDKAARSSLRGELGAANTQYLTSDVAPALQSYFAQRGRSLSPALETALAQESKNLSNETEKYLATLGYQDYSQNKAQSLQNYQDILNRYYQNQDYAKLRSDYLKDSLTQRQNQLQDFYLQKDAYQQYLDNYGKRDWVDYLNTGLNAAGTILGGINAYNASSGGKNKTTTNTTKADSASARGNNLYDKTGLWPTYG